MNDEQIIKELAETTSRSKSNTHRIDKIEKDHEAINKLATSVAVMANEQEGMRCDISDTAEAVKSVKAGIDELKVKPVKRWEAVAEKVILVIVGAVIAWVLARLGIG